MQSSLISALGVTQSGLNAQSFRMRVVAENIANADSTARTPDGLPYRRQVVTFASELDEITGADKVAINDVEYDDSAFQRKYIPGHPSADADGYVLYPNVNTMIEAMDMRAAQRSYEAGLHVVENTRMMLTRTIDLLRA